MIIEENSFKTTFLITLNEMNKYRNTRGIRFALAVDGRIKLVI